MIDVGNYVTIKEHVISNRILILTQEGKRKAADKWSGYYNTIFKVVGVDQNRLLILMDATSNEVHISKNALEIYNLPQD